MSDAPELPAAAVDITEVRRAVDRLGTRPRARPAQVVALALAVVVLLVVIALLGSAGYPGATLLAVGVAGCAVAVAVALVLPTQLATRRRRDAVTLAADAAEGAASAIVSRLSSIGYRVPLATAAEWVSRPDSDATVPLVHDSVIAARWWRPAEGDERVFVEPFLRQDGRDSTLPPLPPL